jgi:hypothetical protein
MGIIINRKDSFIINCRNGYRLNLRPFEPNINSTDFYKALLVSISQYSILEFIGNLMEGQYYINLWAAYFILDIFQPNINEKLIGMNDKKSIVEECIETVERYSVDFGESQKENYEKWILKVKFRYNIHSIL